MLNNIPFQFYLPWIISIKTINNFIFPIKLRYWGLHHLAFPPSISRWFFSLNPHVLRDFDAHVLTCHVESVRAWCNGLCIYTCILYKYMHIRKSAAPVLTGLEMVWGRGVVFGHVDVGRRDGHFRVSSVADFPVTPRREPRASPMGTWYCGRRQNDLDKNLTHVATGYGDDNDVDNNSDDDDVLFISPRWRWLHAEC